MANCMPAPALRTEADWEAAIARIDALIAAGFATDPVRQAEVAQLAEAIQAFEQLHGWAPHPAAVATASTH